MTWSRPGSSSRGENPPNARACIESMVGKPPLPSREAVTSVLLALVMVSSVIVGSVSVAATTTAASVGAPDGMVGVPSEQVSSDLPATTPTGQAAAALAEAGVYASDDAGTLDVIVTSPGRAKEQYTGGNIQGNGPLALVFRDEVAHEGREVAVDAALLEEIVGYRPEVVYGAHESGDEWTKEVRYEEGYAIFEVPKFSENTATFSGGIGLSGDAADDGSRYQYELDSLDGINNFTISASGVLSNQSTSSSGSASGDSTESVTIGGNTAPSGPESGDARLTVTNTGTGDTYENGDSLEIHDGTDNTDTLKDQQMYLSGSGSYDTLTFDIEINNHNEPETIYYDVYVADGDVGPDVFSTGTKVASQSASLSFSGFGRVEKSVSYSGDLSNGVTVGIRPTSSDVSYGANYESLRTTTQGTDLDLSVSTNDGTTTKSITGDGGTVSLPISQDTTALEFTGAGEYDWKLEYQERTLPENVTIDVNGYTTSHDGKLKDGETVSLATNEGWIENGTNNVTVRVDGPSSGPAPLTGFKYQHDAASATTSVDVKATSWIENVTASNTYASDQVGAEVAIVMNERVVEIRELEIRYNETTWESVASSDYELLGNDLVVQLGDLDAETQVEVRAVGSKVGVTDGRIDVLEATTPGDELDTKIQVVERGDNFKIDVGGTATGDRIHYTAGESWSDDESYVISSASGEQALVLPNANNGSTARVRSSELEVRPETGSLEVELVDATEPRFQVRPADTSNVDAEVVWHDTVDGDRYVLARLDADGGDTEVDVDRAESPVSFSLGTDGTYIIEQRDANDEPAVAGPGGARGDDGLLPEWVLLFGGVAASLSALWVVSRRAGGSRLFVAGSAVIGVAALELSTADSFLVGLFETLVDGVLGAAAGVGGALVAGLALLVGLWVLDQRTSRAIPGWILGLAGVAVTLWFVETLAPGALLGPLSSSLEQVGPLVWMALLAGGGFLAYRWIQARRAPDTQVTLEVGGENQ